MARLYSNENFPLPVVEKLRALGHDVLTIQETGKAEQALPDNEVLKFAAAENRVVLTLNRRHFIRLHRESPPHAGIIVCTVDPDFSGQTERIHEAVGGRSSLHGQLMRVNRPAK
jgi:predicted nuclease of predicted toxin-antitoxin system